MAFLSSAFDIYSIIVEIVLSVSRSPFICSPKNSLVCYTHIGYLCSLQQTRQFSFNLLLQCYIDCVCPTVIINYFQFLYKIFQKLKYYYLLKISITVSAESLQGKGIFPRYQPNHFLSRSLNPERFKSQAIYLNTGYYKNNNLSQSRITLET